MEYKELHLNLKRKWYDLILSGRKRFEFREYKKHWKQRLEFPKIYSVVVFRNGYSSNSPVIKYECLGITVRSWKGKKYFVIALGNQVQANGEEIPPGGWRHLNN